MRAASSQGHSDVFAGVAMPGRRGYPQSRREQRRADPWQRSQHEPDDAPEAAAPFEPEPGHDDRQRTERGQAGQVGCILILRVPTRDKK